MKDVYRDKYIGVVDTVPVVRRPQLTGTVADPHAQDILSILKERGKEIIPAFGNRVGVSLQPIQLFHLFLLYVF